MKAKCLFIGTTKYNYRDVKPSPVKYSLLSLMSHVIDIADVEVIDFEMLFGYPRSADEIAGFKEYAKNVLKKKHPDIVLVSCYTSFDYLASIDILEICRYLYPQATLVVGGYHATAVPEDFTGKNVFADYVIRGEGETVLRELITKNGKNMPRIIMGTPMDLSQEKPLRYDLYPYKTDELYISLSRGCFHKCAFCVQSDDYPNPYRKMDVERIKEKIDRATEYFPIKRLMFSDPIFGIDLEETEKLVDFLSRNYPGYSYWAETRIDRLTERLVACLAKLNIDLHFGVESLAEDTLLNLMEKTKNPQHYEECFFRAVDLCQRYHVLGLFGFIMNYPGELAESSQYTLHQIRRAGERYDNLNVTFHINQYALYPGNKIYNMRYKLRQERGFSFPQDGWWHSSEPDIRKRSEDCIASESLRKAYNGDIHYWHAEKNDLLRKYVSKYDLKAYQFYQRDEIRSIISAYDSELENRDDYTEIHKVVAKYRHLISRILALYHKKMDEMKGKEFLKAFDKLFMYAAYANSNQLIKAYLDGMDSESINKMIYEIEKSLQRELDDNMKFLEKEQDNYYLILSGKPYQIDKHGKIQMRRKDAKFCF